MQICLATIENIKQASKCCVRVSAITFECSKSLTPQWQRKQALNKANIDWQAIVREAFRGTVNFSSEHAKNDHSFFHEQYGMRFQQYAESIYSNEPMLMRNITLKYWYDLKYTDLYMLFPYEYL